MADFTGLFLLFTCCFVVGRVTVDALECYGCYLETNELKCNQTYKCRDDEVCYINRLIGDFYGNPCLYNLGCQQTEECSSLQESLQTGDPSPTRIRDGDAIDYMDCCTTSLCNRHLITPPSEMCVVQN